MKIVTRYLAVIFAVAMMICAVSSVSAAKFPDIADDNAHSTAINILTSLGILGGYEDGTFRPDDPIQRDEMAKIIYVTYTTFIEGSSEPTIFPDVPKDSWANGYISWCTAQNIVGGYEDGTFRPDGNITYDEALKMVCCLLGYNEFDSGLWPTDVRQKGILELKLNEKLEELQGSAQISRAEVAQLIYNAFETPFKREYKKVGNLLVEAGPEQTLKRDVWDMMDYEAQIVGTKHYGLEIAQYTVSPKDDRGYKSSTPTGFEVWGTKTDSDDEIQVRLDENTTETFALSDLALDAFKGKTDDLIGSKILMIAREEPDNYVSALFLGATPVDFSSGSNGYSERVSPSTIPDSYDQCAWLGGDPPVINSHYARSIKLDGQIYRDEDFLELRRLHLYPNGRAVLTLSLSSFDEVYYQRFTPFPSRGYKNRLSNTLTGIAVYAHYDKTHFDGYDIDGDGYYEYVIAEYIDYYRITDISGDEVSIEPIYNYSSIDQTNQFNVDNILPLCAGTFNAEDVISESVYKEGDIVRGYIKGYQFYIQGVTTKETGYLTKYDPGKALTLNSGFSVSGSTMAGKGYSEVSLATIFAPITNSQYAIGKNPTTKDYTYFTVYADGTSIVYAEKYSAAAATHDKAILLYVLPETEPQIDESNKRYTTYYPALLEIDGRVQLVNLNKDSAINDLPAETVAKDGSRFRAYYETDTDGRKIVMYSNLLVTYTVDASGYYSLSTVESSKDEELVIPAINTFGNPEGQSPERYTLSIDKETRLVSLTNNEDPSKSINNIMIKNDSIIYYPYTLKSTGCHEYLGSYFGNELPDYFNPIEVDSYSSIYLRYDEDLELYVLSAIVLTDELRGATTGNPRAFKTDARLHLFALDYNEIVLDGENKFHGYKFKNLYTGEDTTNVNIYKELSESPIKAEFGDVLAWFDTDSDYEKAVNTWDSFKENDVVTRIVPSLKVVFTNAYTNGIVIDDDTKIYAINEEEKTIEASDFDALTQTYNAYTEESATCYVTIGTYEDENENVKVAYIIYTAIVEE